jgi:hypothetical protein
MIANISSVDRYLARIRHIFVFKYSRSDRALGRAPEMLFSRQPATRCFFEKKISTAGGLLVVSLAEEKLRTCLL